MPTSIAYSLYSLACLFLVTACGISDPLSKAGAAVGGSSMALLANQLSGGNAAYTAVGAVGGAGLGWVVGKLFDNAQAAQQRALTQVVQSPPGTTVPWDNPRTGHRGTITSGVWGSDKDGPCRVVMLTAVADGQAQSVEACIVQQRDGTWRLSQQP
jgi:surface antigen